jgi:hypothetical protein
MIWLEPLSPQNKLFPRQLRGIFVLQMAEQGSPGGGQMKNKNTNAQCCQTDWITGLCFNNSVRM